MSSVERKTLHFPNRTVDGVNAVGIPGPHAENSSISAPADAAVYGLLGKATEDVGAVRIDLPRKGGTEGAVRAICISPDSAIHSCDVALHGNGGELSRRRISPGNPMLAAADQEADFALVTILMSIPAISLGDKATGLQEAFDRTITGEIDEESTVSFPLRLEVWRGAVPPMRTHQRATYAGNAIGELIDASGGGDSRTFYMCTDGRRRIGLTLCMPNGTGSIDLQCYAVEGYKDTTGSQDLDRPVAIPMVLDDIGSTTLTVTETTPKTIAFDGISPTVLKVVLTATNLETDTGGTFDLRLRAED